jgi:hypothetical protein
MISKQQRNNSQELPPESMFKDSFLDHKDLRRRREILRETVAKLKLHYEHYYQQSQNNLNKWSKQAQENSPDLFRKVAIDVYQGDWGVITQFLTKKYGKCFAVLNMANNQVPGGGYIEGMVAQEENMFRRTDCHFSIRPEYVENYGNYKKEWTDLLNGVHGKVYLDTKDPRICVRDFEIIDHEDLGYAWLSDEDIFPFYEMRSAAVDLRSEIDFDLGIDIDQGIAFDQQECEQRIRAQFQTLVAANIKYVILGAHGCGAFLNPTEKVAETYKKIIEDYKEHFNNISFAIFNAGYGPDNYTPFRRIISGVKKK